MAKDNYLREHIELLWHEYKCMHKEHEPRYAECQVRWIDNDESMPVWIKMNYSKDKRDDMIFFYCNGLNDLLGLLTHGAEDFVLVDVFDFTSRII